MDAKDPFETEPGDYLPEQLGRYVFRRPLAAGGLGVVSVYFDTELKREVALKEIRGECADDTFQRQCFCAEAEVTGLLEHPGVVPIYGMGTGADGRPYYAMRLISGNELRRGIAEFHQAVAAGEASLSGPRLRHLLRPLIDVCNVMHYSHSRGVLHRDLKSGNVMVGRYGETLVIDWGLAKATGECEVERAENGEANETITERPIAISGSEGHHTYQGRAMGTIAYAPPEQLNGRTKEIDATSDCYSIGAILYEVLTGDPPCKGMNITRALRAIEERTIPAPHDINRRIPKPLSAIASKAMSAAKQDRYQNAKELRNDLQRWLDDQPVHAYPETAWERIWRWKRQHETFVRWATASLALVTLVSLGAAYGINSARNQQMKARQEATELYRLARKATDELLTTTGARLESVPDATDIREDLLRDAAASLRAMAQFRTDDPELRRESTRAGIRLADVLKQLGKEQEAIASLAEARRSIETLNDVTDDILRARTYIEQSRVYGKENVSLAAKAAIHGLELTKELAGQPAASSQALLAHAEAQIQTGVVAVDLRDEDSVTSFLDAAETIEAMLEVELDAGRIRDAKLQLIRAYNNCASALPADSPQTREIFLSTIAMATALLERHPGDLPVVTERGKLLNNYGDYLMEDVGDREAAENRYQESTDEFADLVARYPSIAEYKEFLVLSLVGLGKAALDRGNREAAIDRFTEATNVAKNLIEQNRNRVNFLRAAAQAHGFLGEALMGSDPQNAKTQLRSASELLSPYVHSNAEIATEASYAERNLVKLIEAELDSKENLDPLMWLAEYVQQTSSLASANAQYTVACRISQECATIEDAEAQHQYLQIAADRLLKALKLNGRLKSIAVDDKDLQFLMARRPLIFSTLNNAKETP